MFDERFARQYRYEPPPDFRLASPYASIVRFLSGPNRYALTQTYPKISRSVNGAPLKEDPTKFHFHYASGFDSPNYSHIC